MNCSSDFKERLQAKALEEGFSDCRILPANARPDLPEKLRAWLAQGHHGTMGWMEGRAEQRSDPQILWPDTSSIIMLSANYTPMADPMRLAQAQDVGRISVYAQGRDYHDVVKKALKRLAGWLAEQTGAQVKVFVDTAPVMEKPLAQAAGLGWQGKHTNLVSRSQGNWFFLGAIYTDLELAQDTAERDHCGSCNACQSACPTNAFLAPYRLDARRCISYLTIEHDGPIERDLRALMGNHIYGCDDCLAACPWNKFASQAAANKAFLPRAELAAPMLADLLDMDDAAFRQVFAGSPIKRSGRRRMVRNAVIAAGNSGNADYVQPLINLLDDGEDMVRGAAIWALSRLDQVRFAEEKSRRYLHETCDDVRAEWDA